MMRADLQHMRAALAATPFREWTRQRDGMTLRVVRLPGGTLCLIIESPQQYATQTLDADDAAALAAVFEALARDLEDALV